MKRDSEGTDYDRAFTQVINHNDVHESVIAVIRGVSRPDAFEDFKSEVKRYVPNMRVIKI